MSNRILLIGDSLAVGLAERLADLARAAGLELVVDAQNSTRIDQWAGERLRALVEGVAPTLTIVVLGTNDMRQRAPMEKKRGQVVRLVESVVTGNLCSIAPPSMPFGDAGIRRILRDELAPRGIRLFDSESLAIARSPDKIHPTVSGYRAWAEAIATWVPFAAAAEPGEPAEEPDDDAPTEPAGGDAGDAGWLALAFAAALFAGWAFRRKAPLEQRVRTLR